ncbi:hypothetical protein AAFF_G00155280 [Aldrovandia affinis]|uniref:Uncharacterized protein n=1 Tax=Aldrovandia affinis TaxID=143900 RepID=A0AAD7T005_9TELE|nr:hypothetical protein AAFF_G00155280 [Aldrovandia affinis]
MPEQRNLIVCKMYLLEKKESQSCVERALEAPQGVETECSSEAAVSQSRGAGRQRLSACIICFVSVWILYRLRISATAAGSTHTHTHRREETEQKVLTELQLKARSGESAETRKLLI